MHLVILFFCLLSLCCGLRVTVRTPVQMSMLGNIFGGGGKSPSLVAPPTLPSWQALDEIASKSSTVIKLREQQEAREKGGGPPHTDAKLRLFGSVAGEPRVTLYRDSAAWCPYCQKVWIMLEEKRIPYRIEKINMRSYGDKPPAFLRKVPNGLLPAIEIDGNLMTESIDIMLMLDKTFPSPHYPSLWPQGSGGEWTVQDEQRAGLLMRLERDLFSRWCNICFRGSNMPAFEAGLDAVNRELSVTDGPWFLSQISIVDLQFISHIERMLASIPFWSGKKIRGGGRWPALERWLDAFEERPSYMATKSDYYTHVMDIPPQYGPGVPLPGSEEFASKIMGRDGSWSLPLPPFQPTDLEPVSPEIDPGPQAACHEAAMKLLGNHENVIKFACRGAGKKGSKTFQAPLADPYAVPADDMIDNFGIALRHVVHALLQGYDSVPPPLAASTADNSSKRRLIDCIVYLRDRIGVPRDMSYPAARQLRAHLNWLIDQVK